MIKLRDYQQEISDKATQIVNEHGFVYLSMEVRTGKTLTALSVAKNLKPNNVLFLTKKKAIHSIMNDYKILQPGYGIEVVNYESFHKFMDFKAEVIILDEAHSMSALPRPSKRAKQVKEYVQKFGPRAILLSGTPTPESFSQMYHQVYAFPGNPFRQYKNFYAFAKDYVDIKQKMINSMLINDYSRGKKDIIDAMEPYTISYTQEEAGFKSTIKEHVLYVEMEDATYDLCKRLERDLVIEGRDEVILADSAVKLKQKLHQLYSGTIKFESGNSMVLDYSKADFIKDYFKGKRIGIFYKFVEELNAIKEVFGDQVVTTLDEFDSSNCQAIALQIVSGREGISLRKADYIVYYNIDFSATSYWQSRDRATTKDRLNNEIYWIFSKGGIEDKIYEVVKGKKSYTTSHFKKDFKLNF